MAILTNMRAAPARFSVAVEGARRETPPQRLAKARLVLTLAGGPELTREKAEKAVALSLDTYCSVRHSLRADPELSTEVRIEP